MIETEETGDEPVAEPTAELTDDELEALALAADPTERLSDDASPLPGSVLDVDGPLPAWYMPVPARLTQSRGHRGLALVVVGAFLVINALGLCATYGFITLG